MNIINDWNWVLRRAWSVRLIILAAVLSGLEACLEAMVYLGVETPIPSGLFALLAGLVSMAALIARFMAQSRDE